MVIRSRVGRSVTSPATGAPTSMTTRPFDTTGVASLGRPSVPDALPPKIHRASLSETEWWPRRPGRSHAAMIAS